MPALPNPNHSELASNPADVLTVLLAQPSELIGEVVQWLDLEDLLSLRITSRRLHELVHSQEESICARYCRRLRHQHRHLQLPTKIHGLTNDLLFYIELQHRYQTIRRISKTLSSHIAFNLQIKSPLHEKEVENSWRDRKERKLDAALFPSLFTLNNFLECLNSVFVSGEEAFTGVHDGTYIAMGGVYDLDQQRIIEELESCNKGMVRNVTLAFSVLLGVAAARKLSLESKSPKYPFASLKTILIASGLTPLDGLLSNHRSTARRSEQLIKASEQVWHGSGRRPISYERAPLSSIHHLPIDRFSSFEPKQLGRPIKVRNIFMHRQEVWFKAAFAVMQRKGMAEDFPPDTDDWIRATAYEDGDPSFGAGSWSAPDAP